ncbi:hypothetical protein BDW71DRAFT_174552 [Aspergillus fruticulosus]
MSWKPRYFRVLESVVPQKFLTIIVLGWRAVELFQSWFSGAGLAQSIDERPAYTSPLALIYTQLSILSGTSTIALPCGASGPPESESAN